MRFNAASRSASLMVPRFTWRPMFWSMASLALSSCALSTSASFTSKPASAQTWAMPLPIWPAPMTPIFWIMARLSFPGADCVSSGMLFGQRRFEFGHGLEEVGHEAVVGDLEDRRLLVLVDGDDHLAVLHAREMLDGAGDADGDVEVGRDDLAGLPDLELVRHEAGVDRRAAGADRGVELVGDALEQLEVVAALHAAAAGDHDARRGQLRPLGAADGGALEGAEARIAGPGHRLDRGAPAFGRRGVEAGGAHGDDLDLVGRLHGRDRVAGIGRAH